MVGENMDKLTPTIEQVKRGLKVDGKVAFRLETIFLRSLMFGQN